MTGLAPSQPIANSMTLGKTLSLEPAAYLWQTKPSDKWACADVQACIAALGLRHVGIIMDGNRRWARLNNKPSTMGHLKGVTSFRNLVRHASDAKLHCLTAYTFSTENWKRSEEEVTFLMQLIADVLRQELAELHQQQVCIRLLGSVQGLPAPVTQCLEAAMEKTQHNQGLQLQLAINYGGRQELVLAVQSLARKVQKGELCPEAIGEKDIEAHLYSPHVSDPDVIIRPGGESRLSNFLLWQSAYAELHVTPTLWPDFTPQHFNQILADFAKRDRRFGV
jgi:undecaprenyl diphosphate synthase